MRVVIAGGTGFVGRALVARLHEAGHDVVVLTRGGRDVVTKFFPDGVVVERWNPEKAPPVAVVDGADAVVNLAGATIARRWTTAAKRLIVDSRLAATNALVQAMAEAKERPQAFVSASAVGYYGPGADQIITEDSGVGADFLADVCKQWEAAAEGAREHGIRVVTARLGLVLGDGGALQTMALPFKLFVGGPLGTGRQWMPWIHIDDCVGIIEHALAADALDGPVNVVGPSPLRNGEFAKILGRVLGRPAFMPAPAFAMRLLLGEMATMVLTGQRAMPEQATKAGYRFRFDDAEAALQDVLG